MLSHRDFRFLLSKTAGDWIGQDLDIYRIEREQVAGLVEKKDGRDGGEGGFSGR